MFLRTVLAFAFLAVPIGARAAEAGSGQNPFGFPFEFVLFGLILLGVALAHRHALAVALTGLISIIAYELLVTGFPHGPGVLGLTAHFALEWVELTNLALLLLGFAVLANQFEGSRIPDAIPALLPANWTAGLILLALIFVLSIFLDNIAGALIGGVIARQVYRERVSVGFLAGIVAAANAGGAGSVVGDTTTTMMWIGGVSPLDVAPAFLAAGAAFAVFGVFSAFQQHRYAPELNRTGEPPCIDWIKGAVVLFMLFVLVLTNIVGNDRFADVYATMPSLGLALWVSIGLSAFVRQPKWPVLREAAKGAAFLIALVACASLMPIETLPPASWPVTFGLGALSAAFDNIPLTALAIRQGGYDWALLAYAIGFGGSMTWFGSSAGVALTNLYPEGRSVILWVRGGWYVPIAYAVGFFVLLAARGWNP